MRWVFLFATLSLLLKLLPILNVKHTVATCMTERKRERVREMEDRVREKSGGESERERKREINLHSLSIIGKPLISANHERSDWTIVFHYPLPPPILHSTTKLRGLLCQQESQTGGLLC